MMGWMLHRAKNQRQERKRRQRLLTKAQKAHVVNRLDGIVAEQRTWNRRFRTVQRLRVEVFGDGEPE